MKTLRFADEQAMLARNQKGLQKMTDQQSKISTASIMKINIKKDGGYAEEIEQV